MGANKKWKRKAKRIWGNCRTTTHITCGSGNCKMYCICEELYCLKHCSPLEYNLKDLYKYFKGRCIK